MNENQQFNQNQQQNQQDWSESQRVWYEALVAEQTEAIRRIDAPDAHKQWLVDTLAAQFSIQCSICHLHGHDADNCPINAQMYAKTRSHPEYQLAWWLVKQAGKDALEDAKLARKKEAMSLLGKRKALSKLDQKKTLHGLNLGLQ